MRKIRLTKLLVTSSFLALVAAGTDARAGECYTPTPGQLIPDQTNDACINIFDAHIDNNAGAGDAAAGGAALSVLGHVGTVDDQPAISISDSTLTGRIYNAGSITGLNGHDGILIDDSRLNIFVPSGTISGMSNPATGPAVISARGAVDAGSVSNFFPGTITGSNPLRTFNTLAAFDLRSSYMEGGLQNGGHGTITAEGEIGISNAFVSNSGLVKGSGQLLVSNELAGIDISQSTFKGGISNAGTIGAGGKIYTSEDSMVVNTGTVSGAGNFNIVLSNNIAGILFQGSTMSGGVSGTGAAIENSGTIGAEGRVSSSEEFVSNIGTVKASGEIILTNNIGGVVYQDSIDHSGGDIVNSGDIIAWGSIHAGDEFIYNDGSISSSTILVANNIAGIELQASELAGKITNSGMIIATGEIGADEMIYNDSRVSGGLISVSNNIAGIELRDGSTLKGGIANSGVIRGQTGSEDSISASDMIYNDRFVGSGGGASGRIGVDNNIAGIEVLGSTLGEAGHNAGGIANSGSITAFGTIRAYNVMVLNWGSVNGFGTVDSASLAVANNIAGIDIGDHGSVYGGISNDTTGLIEGQGLIATKDGMIWNNEEVENGGVISVSNNIAGIEIRGDSGLYGGIDNRGLIDARGTIVARSSLTGSSPDTEDNMLVNDDVVSGGTLIVSNNIAGIEVNGPALGIGSNAELSGGIFNSGTIRGSGIIAAAISDRTFGSSGGFTSEDAGNMMLNEDSEVQGSLVVSNAIAGIEIQNGAFPGGISNTAGGVIAGNGQIYASSTSRGTVSNFLTEDSGNMLADITDEEVPPLFDAELSVWNNIAGIGVADGSVFVGHIVNSGTIVGNGLIAASSQVDAGAVADVFGSGNMLLSEGNVGGGELLVNNAIAGIAFEDARMDGSILNAAGGVIRAAGTIAAVSHVTATEEGPSGDVASGNMLASTLQVAEGSLLQVDNDIAGILLRGSADFASTFGGGINNAGLIASQGLIEAESDASFAEGGARIVGTGNMLYIGTLSSVGFPFNPGAPFFGINSLGVFNNIAGIEVDSTFHGAISNSGKILASGTIAARGPVGISGDVVGNGDMIANLGTVQTGSLASVSNYIAGILLQHANELGEGPVHDLVLNGGLVQASGTISASGNMIANGDTEFGSPAAVGFGAGLVDTNNIAGVLIQDNLHFNNLFGGNFRTVSASIVNSGTIRGAGLIRAGGDMIRNTGTMMPFSLASNTNVIAGVEFQSSYPLQRDFGPEVGSISEDAEGHIGNSGLIAAAGTIAAGGFMLANDGLMGDPGDYPTSYAYVTNNLAGVLLQGANFFDGADDPLLENTGDISADGHIIAANGMVLNDFGLAGTESVSNNIAGVAIQGGTVVGNIVSTGKIIGAGTIGVTGAEGAMVENDGDFARGAAMQVTNSIAGIEATGYFGLSTSLVNSGLILGQGQIFASSMVNNFGTMAGEFGPFGTTGYLTDENSIAGVGLVNSSPSTERTWFSLENSGTIAGQGFIQASGDMVQNAGTIGKGELYLDNTIAGVEINEIDSTNNNEDDVYSIDNRPGGVIRGLGTISAGGAMLHNSGTVSNEEGYISVSNNIAGVELAYVSEDATLSLDNGGTISAAGVIRADQMIDIDSGGLDRGEIGVFNLVAGVDIGNLNDGGEIGGYVSNSGKILALGTIRADDAMFSNSGKLTEDGHVDNVVGGVVVVDDDLYGNEQGSGINNVGVIAAVGTIAAPFLFRNTGTITGFVSITNDIVGVGLYETELDGDIDNQGTIAAFGVIRGSISNSGVISGNVSITNHIAGIGIEDSEVSGNITNAGIILASGTINVTTSGDTRNVALLDRIDGIEIRNAYVGGTIINKGVIAARGVVLENGVAAPDAINAIDVAGRVEGNINNSGLIDGLAGNGILVAEGSIIGAIINSGTILGGDAAIKLVDEWWPTTIDMRGGLIVGDILGQFDNEDAVNVQSGRTELVGNIEGIDFLTLGTNTGTPAELQIDKGFTANVGSLTVEPDGISATQITPTDGQEGRIVVVNDSSTFFDGPDGQAGTIKAVVTPGLYKMGTTVYHAVVEGVDDDTQNFAAAETTSPFLTVTSVNNQAGDNGIDLNITFNGFCHTGGLNFNAPSVACGIDKVYTDIDPSSPFGELVGNIFGLDTPGASGLFNVLGGSDYAQVEKVSLDLPNLITTTLEQRLHDQRNGGGGSPQSAFAPLSMNLGQLAYNPALDGSDVAPQLAAGDAPTGLAPGKTQAWISGIGDLVHTDGDSFAHGYDQDTGGVLAGLDFGVSDRIRLGVAAGYSHTNVDFNDELDNNNDIDSFHVAGYGSWNTGSLYVDGNVQYEHNSYDSTRFVTPPMMSTEKLQGSYDGNVIGAYGEVGYALHFKPVTLTPEAGLQYTHASIGGFTETGGPAAISVLSQDADSLVSTIGARLTATFKMGRETIVRPELRAFWQHEYLDDEQQFDAFFASAPGSNFTVLGSTFGRDTGIVGVGLTATVAPQVDLFLDYDAQFNDNVFGNALQGGAVIKF